MGTMGLKFTVILLNFLDILKIFCDQSKIGTNRFYHQVMSPKDADRNAK